MTQKPSMPRRSFIGQVGAGAAAFTAMQALSSFGRSSRALAEIGPTTGEARRLAALQMRQDMAQLAYDRPLPAHPDNGEESDYGGTRIASFSKGLPHDALGQVDPASYNALLAALNIGTMSAMESVPMAGPARLVSPLAGLAMDLEGPDNQHLAMRTVPRIDSPENSSEMGELYWMALSRDVSFGDYDLHPMVAAAASDISRFSDFRGPKSGGAVTPRTLFRGSTPGDLAGPYLSQFLLMDIPYGSLTISQRQRTVVGGLNYLTARGAWLQAQNGQGGGADAFDKTARFIRNGRDLGQYVHVDALYEAYLNACLILLGMGAPLDPGHPYQGTTVQAPFATFGGPHILSLVTEVATRALKAVWFEKWFVHRRLRPEEFGGRVDAHLSHRATYPIDEELLNSNAVDEVVRRNNSWLLPQGFPEGCPLHPAYGSGHATVAGACVTILKAWFDESFVIPNPVVPNHLGTRLEPYTGPDADALTVGGELNKVASNIGSGRNFSGIHWRTDMSEGMRLGEEVALGILEEQKAAYAEQGSFTLTRFDGSVVTI
jgi:hypothetical protein